MGSVLFADKGRTSKIERLADGSIRVMARVSRDGLQSYAPWPKAKVQGRPIKVYRPKAEVFADASLRTLKGTTVTVGHPPEKEVTPSTWKKYAVGHNEGEYRTVTGDDGREYVETPIVISDAETIAGIEGRDLVELSQGYSVDLDWTPGTTDEGESYDAVQRNIQHNHTALLGVGQARAGQGARVLLDSSEEPARRKRKMDEKEKAEFAAQIVEKTIKAIDARDKSAADQSERDAKLVADAKAEAKAEFEAEAKAEAEKLADKSDEGEQLSEREQAAAEAKALLDAKDDGAKKALLADAIDAAKKMLPSDYVFEGKSARDIHVDAIERHIPDFKVADKSDEQLAGAFDALKASETKYIADSSKVEKPSSAAQKKVERFSAAFADSWEN